MKDRLRKRRQSNVIPLKYQLAKWERFVDALNAIGALAGQLADTLETLQARGIDVSWVPPLPELIEPKE